MFDIIHSISSRRGIISVAIRRSGDGGTKHVAILIVIIVVFRITTRVVVIVGIIINVVFGIVIIVGGNIVVEAKAPLAIVILCFVFGCSIRLASGGGTVIIRLRKIMIVAFEIISNIVFETWQALFCRKLLGTTFGNNNSIVISMIIVNSICRKLGNRRTSSDSSFSLVCIKTLALGR